MKIFIKFLLFLSTTLWAGEQRIVALAPSINEILFALGKGEEIVGNTTYATYPKASQSIPKVGGYFSVSLEKIINLNPTLVLLQKNNLSLKSKFETLGIKTELISISSLSDIKNSIQKIGSLTGREEKAEKIVKEIDQMIETTKGVVKDKKILIVFGRQFDLKKEIFISGNGIYFADIIHASGNQNAFTEKSSRQPMLSYEGIIAANPDIIYILAHSVDGEQKEEGALIVPWLKLPISAAKTKTIYATTKKYAGMPSNRVVHYIKDFREVLQDAKRKLAPVQD
ncbi:MAG: helical backbone metal receptor [Epsilonproteobacteria bacterium]|nr:helical backbone metal receptor [Campylobacterota bacterium]